MENKKIMPCPFCGVVPAVQVFATNHMTRYSIKCESSLCDIKPATKSYQSKSEVIDIWNKRAESAAE